MFSPLLPLLLIGVAFVQTGCIKTHETRGLFIPDEKIPHVRVGSSQNTVLSEWGSPSTHVIFGEKSWIYIGMKESSISFMTPSIDVLRAIRLDFDPQGKVSRVVHYDQKDSRTVAFLDKKVHDHSHQKTLFNRLFGNIGRFNRAEAVKPRIGGR